MKKCEVKGCKQPAKWGLYKTLPNGKKVWMNVCSDCEKLIGFENLERAGGRVTKRGGKR